MGPYSTLGPLSHERSDWDRLSVFLGVSDRTLHSPLWAVRCKWTAHRSDKTKRKGICSSWPGRIGRQLGVNRQLFHLHVNAHSKAERAVSMSTLHKRSKHRAVVWQLRSAWDQQVAPLLRKTDLARIKGALFDTYFKNMSHIYFPHPTFLFFMVSSKNMTKASVCHFFLIL